MKSGVRVIKRGREDELRGLPPVVDEKSARQSERAMVGTVKGWVAEWEQRRRLDTQSALTLVKLWSA
jgi:hypothetical protein